MNGIIEGERKKQRLPRREKKKLGNGKRGNLASVTRQANLLLPLSLPSFFLAPSSVERTRESEIERENLAGVTNFCCEKFYHSHDGIPPFAHHLPFFFACYNDTSPISQLSSDPDPPNCIWTVASLFDLFQGSFFFLSRAASKQASKQAAGLKSPRTCTTEELSRARPQSSPTIQRLIWALMSDISDPQGCPYLVHHCSTTTPSNSLFLSLLPPSFSHEICSWNRSQILFSPILASNFIVVKFFCSFFLHFSSCSMDIRLLLMNVLSKRWLPVPFLLIEWVVHTISMLCSIFFLSHSCCLGLLSFARDASYHCQAFMFFTSLLIMLDVVKSYSLRSCS